MFSKFKNCSSIVTGFPSFFIIGEPPFCNQTLYLYLREQIEFLGEKISLQLQQHHLFATSLHLNLNNVLPNYSIPFLNLFLCKNEMIRTMRMVHLVECFLI